MSIYTIKEKIGPNSTFIHINNVLSNQELGNLKHYLDNTNDWKISYKYDNVNIQRKQKWFSVDNAPFCSQWKSNHPKWQPHSYCDYLTYLQNRIIKKVKETLPDENVDFNSILINFYDNGDNFISPHQDNKHSFGDHPVIAILSIGSPRTFLIERTYYDQVKRNFDQDNMNKEFILKDNSLLIMTGSSQKYFCHSIKKQPEIKDKRYSFSFRLKIDN